MSAASPKMRYIAYIPRKVLAGQVVVHNHVRPDLDPERRADGVQSMADVFHGMNGFRTWLWPEGYERLERCDCAWAPRLAVHYRVKRQEVT